MSKYMWKQLWRWVRLSNNDSIRYNFGKAIESTYNKKDFYYWSKEEIRQAQDCFVNRF